MFVYNLLLHVNECKEFSFEIVLKNKTDAEIDFCLFIECFCHRGNLFQMAVSDA